MIDATREHDDSENQNDPAHPAPPGTENIGSGFVVKFAQPLRLGNRPVLSPRLSTVTPTRSSIER
jgi:hypothetical protein